MRLYKLPYALQWHEWDELWDQLKKDFPVQYFIRHTIPRALGRHVFARFSRYKWQVIHRFHPKHRYHIIKPRTLKPGYHDPDRRVMHAMFHEASTFAENRLMGDGVDGTHWNDEDGMDDDFFTGEQFKREKQIIELRNWWVIDRKNRKQAEELMWDHLADIEVPKEWGESWILNSKHDGTPQKEEYDKRSKKLHEFEEQCKEEDRRKMHELVDLLPFLWY